MGGALKMMHSGYNITFQYNWRRVCAKMYKLLIWYKNYILYACLQTYIIVKKGLHGIPSVL